MALDFYPQETLFLSLKITGHDALNMGEFFLLLGITQLHFKLFILNASFSINFFFYLF